MRRKIAVLGTGAIGSSVGADLTKAGYDVLLLDQWPAHIEAMKAHGLHVTMPQEKLHVPVRAFHVGELCTLHEQFDIVLLAAKSYDTCWMVELIKPYLKPDGMLVSLQNSLNDEWIAPVIGHQRDIPSVVELSAEVFEPGRVKRNTDYAHTWFAVGELHGRVTPRIQEVAQILGAAGVTDISSNISGAKWSKLMINCMTMGIDGILGIYAWETQRPEIFKWCIGLGKEAHQVGLGLGYTLEPIAGMSAEDLLGPADALVEKSMKAILSTIGKEARSCVHQDHLKGRQSEVDYLNGLVVKKGREAKVPTPLNEAVTLLTKQIEQGKLKPAQSNLTILDKYWSGASLNA